QPARTNWPGVRPSIAHGTLPPLSSSTDRTIHTCGFVHFHSVTVPVRTITLAPSNAELLWGAGADAATSNTAMTHEPILICDPPRWRRDISTVGTVLPVHPQRLDGPHADVPPRGPRIRAHPELHVEPGERRGPRGLHAPHCLTKHARSPYRSVSGW